MGTQGKFLLIAILFVSFSAVAKTTAKPARKSVSLKLVLVSDAPGGESDSAKTTKTEPVKEEVVPRKKTLKPRVRKPASLAKRPSPPVQVGAPVTKGYEKSSINFNGLIAKADERQTRLEKRMKVKTTGHKKIETKVAHYGFEDSEMKWAAAPASSPKASAAVSQPRAPQSNESFSLELRPKKP